MTIQKATKASPDSADKNKSTTRQALPQILAVCAKNILLLDFGMTLGFPTILIPSLSGNDPLEKISLGSEAISWIGSINLICVPLGCFVSGAITQPLGRKRSMQMVNIPFFIAWILFYFSTKSWHVFLALCITGVSGGLLEAPVLTYVAEICQPHLRGILSSTSTMAVVLGILMQFVLGTFISWRIVALINCCFPIFSFISLIFIPETPIWLVSKRKFEEARKSIAWLRGWVKVETVEEEFQEVCKQVGKTEADKLSENSLQALKKKKRTKTDKLKLFGKKSFTWPYFIVSLCFFLGHFNGNTVLQVYAIKIFSVLKAPINKYYATVLLGVVQLLGCVFSVFFVNILGKRIINFISLFGSGICFIIVATYAYLNEIKYFDIAQENSTVSNVTSNITFASGSGNFQWIPMTFLVISAFLSFLGIKILPWILTGEVYCNYTRATASGLSGGIAYIFGFLSNKIFLNLVSAFTLPGVFWFYGFVGVLGTVLLYFILPETEGKSLFEIQEHFAGRKKLNNKVSRIGGKKCSGQSNPAFESDEINERYESKL